MAKVGSHYITFSEKSESLKELLKELKSIKKEGFNRVELYGSTLRIYRDDNISPIKKGTEVKVITDREALYGCIEGYDEFLSQYKVRGKWYKHGEVEKI